MDFRVIMAVVIIIVGLLVASATLRLDFSDSAAELEKACVAGKVDPSYCK